VTDAQYVTAYFAFIKMPMFNMMVTQGRWQDEVVLFG
jgi:hypothetical protein